MDTSKETPITKYLANLEKRKTIFRQHPPTTPSPISLYPQIPISRYAPPGMQVKINFDDTFFTRDENESILHISPLDRPIAGKRRRTSVLFEDTPNVEALQKKNGELERLLMQTQGELVEGRAAYTKLDQLNIEMRRKHIEHLILIEKAQEELKIKSKNSTERAESMEKRLLKLQQRDTDSGRDFQTQVTTQITKIANLEDTLATVQNEKMELQQKILEESIKNEQTIQKLQLELDTSEKLSSKSTHEAIMAQSKLSEVMEQLEKCQLDLKEAQLDLVKSDELKQQYETAHSAEGSNDVILLERQLRKLENRFIQEQLVAQNATKLLQKTLEENEILKTTVKKEDLLEEQLISKNIEIGQLKLRLQEKSLLEAERNNLRNELKAWVSTATKLDISCRTPLSFDTLFRQNQDLLLHLKLENSTYKHTTETDARQLGSMKAEAVKSKEELESLKAEIVKLTLQFKKTKWRMNMLVQDRDGLRELKESYEKEFDGIISEPLQTRIVKLEALVAEFEKAIDDDPSLKKNCEECNQRLSIIGSLKSELEIVKDEKDKLSQSLAEFNQTLTADPTTGLKIVSFGNNPSLLSVEERLKECQVENESLRAKIRKYEEDTLVAVPDADLLKEKKDLEEKLRTLERKHEILTDSYDYETVQLQNACTKLFGYYVILTRGGGENPNQFRLQSIYSTAPDDMFILQEGDAGEMLLLDTPILAHFQDDIERFLRQECSVPAFLSAVTITYAQGSQFPSGGENDIMFNDSGNQEATIQVLETETLNNVNACASGREVQIEVEGEEDDDEDEEEDGFGEGVNCDGETDEDDYDEDGFDEVKAFETDDDDDDDDDDDVVTID